MAAETDKQLLPPRSIFLVSAGLTPCSYKSFLLQPDPHFIRLASKEDNVPRTWLKPLPSFGASYRPDSFTKVAKAKVQSTRCSRGRSAQGSVRQILGRTSSRMRRPTSTERGTNEDLSRPCVVVPTLSWTRSRLGTRAAEEQLEHVRVDLPPPRVRRPSRHPESSNQKRTKRRRKRGP